MSVRNEHTNREQVGLWRTQERLTGLALVLLAAVVFSTAGLFTKSVAADAWSVIFWRGISAATFSLLYLALRRGLRKEMVRLDRPAVLAAVLLAAGTAAFIPAFKLTTIANVAMIWATAPFVAGLLAWAIMNEKPRPSILAASGLALLGVLIIVGGSIDGSHWQGDLLACWMTLMMAGVVVLYRFKPQTPTVIPAALSSILLLAPAFWLTNPWNISVNEIWILLCFGGVFAVASITLSEGAKRLPAAETALLSAIETPLAPLWAFLILSEFPSGGALFGSGLILVAVLAPQIKRWKRGL